ncbi:hypothetical protein FRAAL1070 [Frankia alni ACN14a]|uniref:Uncharacterized protein n=1 Tax=Frankia alni (strain DSM 45986 / CECT 9034 / ACN14a) TaxID=326424 RepID=Q0RRT1_FRAAA|nr:hypothetical protein FRAAL1070 [Frankia alni ACN14a]
MPFGYTASLRCPFRRIGSADTGSPVRSGSLWGSGTRRRAVPTMVSGLRTRWVPVRREGALAVLVRGTAVWQPHRGL